MLVLPLLLAHPVAHAGPVRCLRVGRGVYERPALSKPVSMVSDVVPVRVWYAQEDPLGAAIAETTLAAAEQAWAVQVHEIGFREPLLPDAEDGPEFDIYLVEYYEEAAYVAPDPGPDPVRGDGYSSISSYMVLDHRIKPELVASYVAHELNHASQWTYDWTELTLPLWEGTATAAERWTLGGHYDWGWAVPSFQEVPWMPALVGDSTWSWHEAEQGYFYEYGSALWVMWLDEAFGDGAGAGGVALWEATASEGRRREPDVVDAFGVVAGTSPLEALAELAEVRWRVGPDAGLVSLVDADGWPADRQVAAERFTGDDLPLRGPPETFPMITGQAFAEIDLSGARRRARSTLEISVASASGLDTALTVMWWATDGTTGTEIATDEPHEVSLPARDLERVVVGITNGGPPGWDGDDDPYVPGDQEWAVEIARGGCGCAAAPGLAPVGLGGVLLLFGVARRRRVRRSATRSSPRRATARTPPPRPA